MSKFKQWTLAAWVAVILGFAISPDVFAAYVPQGGVIPVSGTTAAIDPTLTGSILFNNTSQFSISLSTGGNITGAFQDVVIRNSLGTLDFYSQITSDSTSTPSATIDAFSRGYLSQYPGASSFAYMDYLTGGLGTVAPLDAVRSIDSSSAGFYFNFGNGVGAGQGSYFMFYRTTATSFNVLGTGYVAHYNGIGVDPYNYSNTLTLAQPVPEPSEFLLMLSGFGLIGFVARRRNTFNI